MKLVLGLNDFSWPQGARQLGPTLVRIAQAAEAAGFDRISNVDHVWQSHYLGGPEHEVPSCYPTLTYLAAHTSRIKLLALATARPYWHPVLLAKTVTTLDVLSGGRAWLGIGAGDYEEEARGSGLPFPPLKERYERLEEMLQICLRMWHGEQGDERPFEGKHYRIQRPLNLPQSLRRPHPPILIAGGGEQKTLRLVARYADACNLRPGPEIPKKLDSRLCCTWGPAGILGTPHHSCRHRRRTVRAVAGREYLRSVRPHAPCLGDRSGRPPLCHSGRPAGDHCARRRRRPQHGGQHHLPSGNPGGPRRRPGAAGDTHCTSSTGAPHVGLTRKMRRSMFQ